MKTQVIISGSRHFTDGTQSSERRWKRIEQKPGTGSSHRNLRKNLSECQEIGIEEETFKGKTAYEVEYKKNGKEYEFLLSADGALLQKEKEIDGKSLPEPVVQAIKKAYPKAEIKEVEKLMRPDNTVTGYEVELKAADKEIKLELNVDGNILKTEDENLILFILFP